LDPRPWILKDSQQFARLYGFIVPQANTLNQTQQDSTSQYLEKLSYKLHACVRDIKSLDELISVMGEYCTSNGDAHANFTENASSDANKESSIALNPNLDLLNALGYYGPGVVEVEGEFYAPNRLHHLERRIMEMQRIDSRFAPMSSHKSPSLSFGDKLKISLHLLTANFNSTTEKQQFKAPFFSRQLVDFQRFSTFPSKAIDSTEIELFYSFRSPYSQLAILQLIQITSISAVDSSCV
jgi:hypothetical protein